MRHHKNNAWCNAPVGRAHLIEITRSYLEHEKGSVSERTLFLFSTLSMRVLGGDHPREADGSLPSTIWVSRIDLATGDVD